MITIFDLNGLADHSLKVSFWTPKIRAVQKLSPYTSFLWIFIQLNERKEMKCRLFRITPAILFSVFASSRNSLKQMSKYHVFFCVSPDGYIFTDIHRYTHWCAYDTLSDISKLLVWHQYTVSKNSLHSCRNSRIFNYYSWTKFTWWTCSVISNWNSQDSGGNSTFSTICWHYCHLFFRPGAVVIIIISLILVEAIFLIRIHTTGYGMEHTQRVRLV